MDPARGQVNPELELRLARPGETSAALRMVLGANGVDADDLRVADFLRYAVRRRLDLSQLSVAVTRATGVGGLGRVVWAVLPIVSPGRTMIVLTPSRVPVGVADTGAALIRWALAQHPSAVTAQALVDPADAMADVPLRLAGFSTLATLHYLQRGIPASPPPPGPLPAGMRVVHYSGATDKLFQQALVASYIGSQDCAQLTGVRDIEDVIAGHQSTGGSADFDPTLWTVVAQGSVPAAVLLMGPIDGGGDGAMEIVYLGVSPEFRRHGLGRWCVREAMRRAHERGQRLLTLAVDSTNQPALRLYHAAGMARVNERLALFRDLRPIPAAGAAHAAGKVQASERAAEPESGSNAVGH